MSLENAACRGQSALFDSTDLRDHLQARQICAGCPALAACAIELRAVQQSTRTIRNSGGGPSGTWAGKLFGKQGGKALETECGTDRGYYRHRYLREAACEACKRAHAHANRKASA